MRLDHYLVERGFFESRARAQSAIKDGLVLVDGVTAKKPSAKISATSDVVINGDVHPFVSRGGVKLAAALDAFDFNPAEKTCLDLGASTGGFTDVLLRAGAAKIYAVDVGHGQLHERIAGDPRVISLEKTHTKVLTPVLVPEPIDLIVCDVSFISLKKALPHALALAHNRAQFIALIKPQFEVGRTGLGKGGIVKQELLRPTAEAISQWVEDDLNWHVVGLIDSPVAGGDGNKEFLIGAAKAP